MALRLSGSTGITDGEFDYEDEINSKSTKVYVDSKPSGFKNYIINGNFDIWQRGTSQDTTVVGYGSDDRWDNYHRGSTKTHSRQTCTDTERVLFNAQYYSRTVVSKVEGVFNQCDKFQLIEDVTKLAGKTVTLSFWARADSTKNIAVDFGQKFGTGGTPSAEVDSVGVTTFNLTTNWKKFAKTVTYPSIVGKTLGTDGVHTTSSWFVFWFSVGSLLNARTNNLGEQSGTFDIAQVQLEEGSVATPFENRPYGLELSLCQRYFQKVSDEVSYTADSSSITTQQHHNAFPAGRKYLLPVVMRVSPTLSYTSFTHGYTGPSAPTLKATSSILTLSMNEGTTGITNPFIYVSGLTLSSEL